MTRTVRGRRQRGRGESAGDGGGGDAKVRSRPVPGTSAARRSVEAACCSRSGNRRTTASRPRARRAARLTSSSRRRSPTCASRSSIAACPSIRCYGSTRAAAGCWRHSGKSPRRGCTSTRASPRAVPRGIIFFERTRSRIHVAAAAESRLPPVRPPRTIRLGAAVSAERPRRRPRRSRGPDTPQ